MRRRISANKARDTATSANWNTMQRPWRTILIESNVARYENDLARATATADREALRRAARELRYWTARLASAEVAEPDPEADHVVFGMAVTILREDETEATFRIVGEDEANPSTGRIAWTARVAQALLGSRPGDVRQLPTGEVEDSRTTTSTGCASTRSR